MYKVIMINVDSVYEWNERKHLERDVWSVQPHLINFNNGWLVSYATVTHSPPFEMRWMNRSETSD